MILVYVIRPVVLLSGDPDPIDQIAETDTGDRDRGCGGGGWDRRSGDVHTGLDPDLDVVESFQENGKDRIRIIDGHLQRSDPPRRHQQILRSAQLDRGDLHLLILRGRMEQECRLLALVRGSRPPVPAASDQAQTEDPHEVLAALRVLPHGTADHAGTVPARPIGRDDPTGDRELEFGAILRHLDHERRVIVVLGDAEEERIALVRRDRDDPLDHPDPVRHLRDRPANDRSVGKHRIHRIAPGRPGTDRLQDGLDPGQNLGEDLSEEETEDLQIGVAGESHEMLERPRQRLGVRHVLLEEEIRVQPDHRCEHAVAQLRMVPVGSLDGSLEPAEDPLAGYLHPQDGLHEAEDEDILDAIVRPERRADHIEPFVLILPRQQARGETDKIVEPCRDPRALLVRLDDCRHEERLEPPPEADAHDTIVEPLAFLDRQEIVQETIRLAIEIIIPPLEEDDGIAALVVVDHRIGVAGLGEHALMDLPHLPGHILVQEASDEIRRVQLVPLLPRNDC